MGTASESNMVSVKLYFLCSLSVFDSFLESSWSCCVLATVLLLTPEQRKQLKYFSSTMYLSDIDSNVWGSFSWNETFCTLFWQWLLELSFKEHFSIMPDSKYLVYFLPRIFATPSLKMTPLTNHYLQRLYSAKTKQLRKYLKLKLFS